MAFLPLLLDSDGFLPPMVSQGTHWDTPVRAAGSLCLVFGGDWQEPLVVGWGTKGSLCGVRETWARAASLLQVNQWRAHCLIYWGPQCCGDSPSPVPPCHAQRALV